MKKNDKYVLTGVFFNCIALFSSKLEILHDFFNGFLLALGLVFIFYGAISEGVNIKNVAKKKTDVFKNMIRKKQ